MIRTHWNINKTLKYQLIYNGNPAYVRRRSIMREYQLIYNGNPAYPLCDTKEEAESFKKKAAEKHPQIKVKILPVYPA